MRHNRYCRSPAQAQKHYHEMDMASRIEGTNAHGLVAMLYEELLQSIDVMQVTIKRGGDIRSHPQSARARSILLALLTGLDFKSGGSLAASLASVYNAMAKEMGIAIEEASLPRLRGLREGVASISEAWAKVVTPAAAAA